MFIAPHQPLYDTSFCLGEAGIANFEPNKSFSILIEHFGEHSIKLMLTQVLGTADMHQQKTVESGISHGKMLGLISDDTDTKNRKRNVNARDIETINKNLSDGRERHMGTDEIPITAKDLNFDITVERQGEVCNMLQKHEQMWSGQLGEITVS